MEGEDVLSVYVVRVGVGCVVGGWWWYANAFSSRTLREESHGDDSNKRLPCGDNSIVGFRLLLPNPSLWDIKTQLSPHVLSDTDTENRNPSRRAAVKAGARGRVLENISKK